MLIFAMFYDGLSFYLLYKFDKKQQWVAKVEDARKSEFHIIKLNASLYSFADDTDFEQVNQEVIIGNKSFHVFKKRIKDNILELYVLNQLNETSLDVNLSKLAEVDFHDNSDLSKSPLQKLLQLLTFEYVFSKSIVCEIPLLFECDRVLSHFQKQQILGGFFDLPYCPPKNLI